jgi:hypothetical protein
MWYRRWSGEESLSEAASSGPLSRWINGVILLPPVPIAVGVWFLLQGVAFIPGRWPAMTLQGPAALAMGIGCIAAGFLTHFHWFWSGHPRFAGVGQIGKAVTLLAISICALYLFFSYWIG